jgi:hypothetical protein
LPPCERRYGRTVSSACLHPLLDSERVQAVQQQQARHHFVIGAGVEDGAAGFARAVQVLQQAPQAGGVQVEDGTHQGAGV